MMVGAEEIRRSLRGCLLLARFDASGLAHFNVTPAGFWNSFLAPAAIFPGQLLLRSGPLGRIAEEAGWGRVLLAEAVVYAVIVLAFPVAVHLILPLIGRRENFIRYIVAYNWSAVIQMAILLPAGLLVNAGGGAFLGTVAGVLVLVYAWFITRIALDVTRGVAAAFVLGDVVLTSAIAVAADAAIYGT